MGGDIFRGVADDREDDDAEKEAGEAELSGCAFESARNQLGFPGGERGADKQDEKRLQIGQRAFSPFASIFSRAKTSR